jgi:cell wall-associated NlpC family hydrolase
MILLTQMFGVDLPTILSANDIANADLITPGTKLRIPPVTGREHEVQSGETLADIARLYEVDLGPILDFNDLADPDVIRAGMRLVVPGAKKPQPSPAPPAPQAQAPAAAPAAAAPRPAAPAAVAKPAAPAPQPGPRPAPPPAVTGSGAAIVKNAMGYRGYPYVFGGTSPAGFDCSGFVWYVYRISGNPISRAMWGQLNAGPRISRESLEPGDIVFFANTYMPGLSHNGIYVGGGQFIHASDPSVGVVVSSMSSSYWASRYVGASRP